MKTIAAAEVSNAFLAMLDEAASAGEPLVILDDTKWIARVIPVRTIPPLKEGEDPLAFYRIGGVTIVGDVVSPVCDPEDWEYD